MAKSKAQTHQTIEKKKPCHIPGLLKAIPYVENEYNHFLSSNWGVIFRFHKLTYLVSLLAALCQELIDPNLKILSKEIWNCTSIFNVSSPRVLPAQYSALRCWNEYQLYGNFYKFPVYKTMNFWKLRIFLS